MKILEDIQALEVSINALLVEQENLLNHRLFAALPYDEQLDYCRFNGKIAQLNFLYYEHAITIPSWQEKAAEAFLRAYNLGWKKAEKILLQDWDYSALLDPLISSAPLHASNLDYKQIFLKAVICILTAQNRYEALRLLKYAAENGYPNAQCCMGEMYWDSNHVLAQQWLSLAAEQGHPSAQSSLANLLFENQSNIDETYRLWRLAADQGWAQAQSNLGHIYEKGSYVVQNYDKALNYYRLAAEQNRPVAMWNVGGIYSLGEYEKRDIALAYNYYRMAAEHAHPTAIRLFKGRALLRVSAISPVVSINGPLQFYQLIQKAPGAIPTDFYYVDNKKISRLDLTKQELAMLLVELYPSVTNHVYYNIENLSLIQLEIIQIHTEHNFIVPVPIELKKYLYLQYHQGMLNKDTNAVVSLLSEHTELLDVLMNFDFKRSLENQDLQLNVEKIILTLLNESPHLIHSFLEKNLDLVNSFNIFLCLALDSELHESDRYIDVLYIEKQGDLLSKIDFLSVEQHQIEPMLNLLFERWWWIKDQIESMQVSNHLNSQQCARCIISLFQRADQLGHSINDRSTLRMSALVFIKALYGDAYEVSMNSICCLSHLKLFIHVFTNPPVISVDEMNQQVKEPLIIANKNARAENRPTESLEFGFFRSADNSIFICNPMTQENKHG